jgi:O-antigen/teichoic acid export membrane protein
MSRIRRQSIISTVIVYLGFAIGFINTYLFTRQGSPFSATEYGITQIFMQVGNIMFAFANLGMVASINKFFPYYNDHLERKKNDQLTWALLISIIGFLLVLIAGFVFKDLVVRKFTRQAPEFVHYYFWIFPFGFSLLIFYVFEMFAWNVRRSVISNFLREVLFRLTTTALILAVSFSFIKSFDTFIKIYAFSYGIVAIVLIVYLAWKKELYLTTQISKVTRRLYKKIAVYAAFVYSGGLIFTIATFIDGIVILALVGPVGFAVFSLATFISNFIQAPQRGAISSSTPVLAQAWKDHNISKIDMIYKRSSINLIIAALGLFCLIWLNYKQAIDVFNMQTTYLQSYNVFICLAIARTVDLGTGVNSQIIATSNFWRFEFVSGMVLLSIMIPLNYILVKQYGIIGAGYSNIISFTVYNGIRIIFLYRKFKMQPFTLNTLYALLIAAAAFIIVYYPFSNVGGFPGLFLRSILFLGLYGGAVTWLKLSPDIIPVLKTISGKMKIPVRVRFK